MRHSLLIILWVVFYACHTRTAQKPIVALQPMSFESTEQIDSVKSVLERYYGFSVVVLENTTIPESTFINVRSPRYRADKVLKYLNDIKPDTCDFIMGLTTKDISTTKWESNGKVKQPASRYLDWGIFGLGYRPGDASIISTFRLGNNPDVALDRLQKICMHELGHNLGLSHCETYMCVMSDAAESIKTIDNEAKSLCSKCQSKAARD